MDLSVDAVEKINNGELPSSYPTLPRKSRISWPRKHASYQIADALSSSPGNGDARLPFAMQDFINYREEAFNYVGVPVRVVVRMRRVTCTCLMFPAGSGLPLLKEGDRKVRHETVYNLRHSWHIAKHHCQQTYAVLATLPPIERTWTALARRVSYLSSHVDNLKGVIVEDEWTSPNPGFFTHRQVTDIASWSFVAGVKSYSTYRVILADQRVREGIWGV